MQPKLHELLSLSALLLAFTLPAILPGDSVAQRLAPMIPATVNVCLQLRDDQHL